MKKSVCQMVDAFLFVASTIVLLQGVFLRSKIGGVVVFGYPLAIRKIKNS